MKVFDCMSGVPPPPPPAPSPPTPLRDLNCKCLIAVPRDWNSKLRSRMFLGGPPEDRSVFPAIPERFPTCQVSEGC